MTYEHRQTAPTLLIFLPLFGGFAVVAWLARDEPAALAICLVAMLSFSVLALGFRQLEVKDEGDQLTLRYGPLPVFTKRIRYRDIESVEPGRSGFLDGWGVHWLPGRGWIYNLWGFDCVELRVRGRRLRIGSDDVPNLVAYLRTRTGST